MFAIMVRKGGKIVAIAGNLSAAALPELQQELEQVPRRTLDCSELRRVDQAGVAFLRRWQRAGGTMVGVSQRVALLLEAQPEAQFSEPDDRSVTR